MQLLVWPVRFVCWRFCLCVCKKIQNTEEIQRTLFNWTKQDKTCIFSRRSFFQATYNIKTKNKQLIQVKCARFVLSHPMQMRSFNSLCVLYLFFRTLAVNSVSDLCVCKLTSEVCNMAPTALSTYCIIY